MNWCGKRNNGKWSHHEMDAEDGVKVSCLSKGFFLYPSLPVASPLPSPLRSIRRKCSKEPLLVLGPSLLRSIGRKCSKESVLVLGPSFSFLETFGEKAGASVV